MTKIKIYCLEDQEENNIVTILGEGEHPIGRGDTLKCNDKKVSRNHAVIVVNETEVVLKSAHVNPSFYRAANGKTIQLLKKDDSVSLHNGDCFALLADKFWFRIKIELNENSSTDSPTENRSIKRSIDTQINECSKRFRNAIYDETVIKTSKIEGLDSFLNRIAPGNATVKNIDTDSLLNNLVNITKEDYGANNVTTDDDSSGIDKNNASAVSLTESIEETKKEMSAEDKLVVYTNRFNRFCCGYPPTFDEECDNLTENQLVDETKILNSREEGTEDQAKNDISDDSEESMDLATENVLKGDFWCLTKPDNFKQFKEKVDDPERSNLDENPSSSHISSSSMDTKPNTRRDRCWYAETCYRKNPSHRAQFSHPGDDDFNNDCADEDAKPQCQFGTACYRKNAEHRKKFQHSIQPGDNEMPKKAKNNANDNKSVEELGSSDSEQDSRHAKRSKAVKKVKSYQDTPEDDYDMEDPFINDGSSDDFQPSSVSADDDTDWEDSQKVDEDSNETKRLLKEAKKCTEVKNKK